MELHFPMTFSK